VSAIVEAVQYIVVCICVFRIIIVIYKESMIWFKKNKQEQEEDTLSPSGPFYSSRYCCNKFNTSINERKAQATK